MTWDSAFAYCEGLFLGGYADWRLPNIKELLFLTDDVAFSPSIDTTLFPAAYASYYWSSTSSAVTPDSALHVNFIPGGFGIGTSKGNSIYVRCVRGGQLGSLSKLSISKNGMGSGTVVSSPGGINCGGTCSAYYPIDSGVVLTSTPSAGGSIFSGWSGDSDCFDGVATLSTDKTCVATFDLCNSTSIAIAGSSGPFDSIKAAYEGASSPDTIRIIASNQQEGDIVFADKNLALQGGYDCAFTEPPNSFTTITGSLSISRGSINIAGIRIQ